MALIELRLFGGFKINLDGKNVAGILNKSPKSLDVFQHLIINSHRFVGCPELIELFWGIGGGEGCEKTGAVKTLISRLRKRLNIISPKFDKVIISSSKGYRFVRNENFVIDIFMFDALCNLVLESLRFNKKIRRAYMQILRVYKGPIVSQTQNMLWENAVNKERSLNYNNAMAKLVRRLKSIDDFENTLYVAKAVAEINPFNEEVIKARINALFKLNRRTDAFRYYRELIVLYEKSGEVIPKNIAGFYKTIANSQIEHSLRLESICGELGSAELLFKPAVCDFLIFKYIFCTLLKSLENLEAEVSVMLVSISSKESEINPIFIDSIMEKLEGALLGMLKKENLISRYSFSQFLILFPFKNFSEEIYQAELLEKFDEFYPDYDEKISIEFETKIIKP